jgi:hypothetical protein
MKRRSFAIAMAASLASLIGMGSVSSANVALTSSTVAAPIKADRITTRTKKLSVTNTIGGIPLTHILSNYGLSPKEYGIRYGRKSKGGKTNRLRLAHNAKVNRRKAA